MYDELIKNLRVAGDFVSLSGYQRDLRRQAADAIEELSKQVEKWEEIADIWRAAYGSLERIVYPKYPKENGKSET